MSELPSHAAFAACLHTHFQFVGDPAPGFDLELVNVSELLVAPRQQTFSLIFHGPAAHFLTQGIYHLAHHHLGEMDLFLVPIGRKADIFSYEVVFNRLLPPGSPG